MTHVSTHTMLPSSCPILSRWCHLIEQGSEGRQKVRGGFGGIIAGCQMLVIYVVVVRRASNWLGEITGVKPRDKLDSTGSLGWYTGSAGRFWGWPSYLISFIFGKLGKAWDGEVIQDPRDVESGIWEIAWSGIVLWQMVKWVIDSGWIVRLVPKAIVQWLHICLHSLCYFGLKRFSLLG